MKLFFKRSILLLSIASSCAFGIGDLLITNTTLGLLRFQIVRDGVRLPRSPAIAPGTVFKRKRFLETGDLITFLPADNTAGPILLEDLLVIGIDGRTADVIISYKGDGFDTQQI